jgi:hypothetical protein
MTDVRTIADRITAARQQLEQERQKLGAMQLEVQAIRQAILRDSSLKRPTAARIVKRRVWARFRIVRRHAALTALHRQWLSSDTAYHRVEELWRQTEQAGQREIFKLLTRYDRPAWLQISEQTRIRLGPTFDMAQQEINAVRRRLRAIRWRWRLQRWFGWLDV